MIFGAGLEIADAQMLGNVAEDTQRRIRDAEHDLGMKGALNDARLASLLDLSLHENDVAGKLLEHEPLRFGAATFVLLPPLLL